MNWSFVRLCLAGSLGLAALGVAPEARAEGESCVRDTDCEGAELCEGGVCAVSESPPASCDAGCEPLFEVCDDGFCKPEGVVCENPAGRCWYEGTSAVDGVIDEGHTECECADGSASGGTHGYNPDDPPAPPPDEEQLVLCEQTLTSICGTEAPTLPDSCQGDILTECEALVAIEDAARLDCGYDVPEVTIARVGECCDGYAEAGLSDYQTCMLEKTEPECADLDACIAEASETEGATDGEGAVDDGTTDPTGADTDDAQEGEVEQDSDSASGCSVGEGGRGWMLLGLVGLLGLRRRRSA